MYSLLQYYSVLEACSCMRRSQCWLSLWILILISHQYIWTFHLLWESWHNHYSGKGTLEFQAVLLEFPHHWVVWLGWYIHSILLSFYDFGSDSWVWGSARAWHHYQWMTWYPVCDTGDRKLGTSRSSQWWLKRLHFENLYQQFWKSDATAWLSSVG